LQINTQKQKTPTRDRRGPESETNPRRRNYAITK